MVCRVVNEIVIHDRRYGNDEDVIRFMNLVNRDRQTAVHIASERGYCDVVRSLLAAKADVNVYDHGECSPIHLACSADQNVVSDAQSSYIVQVFKISRKISTYCTTVVL